MLHTLTKTWGPHAAGTRVTVEPAEVGEGVVLIGTKRLEYLVLHGFILLAPPPEATPPPASSPAIPADLPKRPTKAQAEAIKRMAEIAAPPEEEVA